MIGTKFQLSDIGTIGIQLDPDLGVVESEGKIATWTDQSENGYIWQPSVPIYGGDVSAGGVAADYAPTKVAATLNGHAVIDFDSTYDEDGSSGTGQLLDCTFGAARSANDYSKPETWFIVAKRRAWKYPSWRGDPKSSSFLTDAVTLALDEYRRMSNEIRGSDESGQVLTFAYNGSAGHALTSNWSPNDYLNSWFIQTDVIDVSVALGGSGLYRVRYNQIELLHSGFVYPNFYGVTIIDDGFHEYQNYAGLRIGRRQNSSGDTADYFDGQLAYLLVIEKACSLAEICRVEQWLKRRFDL